AFTLSLHDALPICDREEKAWRFRVRASGSLEETQQQAGEFRCLRPGGAVDGSQGWSAAKPLVWRDTQHHIAGSPGGATALQSQRYFSSNSIPCLISKAPNAPRKVRSSCGA